MSNRSLPPYLRVIWEGLDTAGARDSTAQFRPGYRFLQQIVKGIDSLILIRFGREISYLPIVTRDSSFLPENRTLLEGSLPSSGGLLHGDGRLRM